MPEIAPSDGSSGVERTFSYVSSPVCSSKTSTSVKAPNVDRNIVRHMPSFSIRNPKIA